MTSIRLGDEKFTLNGVDYWFMFPEGGGSQAFTSASPFAPKSQTGERSYADYDAYSMLAQADFSGGMGQERFTDTTKYYDGQNVDTRSGHLVLGPYVTATAASGLTNESLAGAAFMEYTIRSGNYELAAVVTGTGQIVRHIWLPLRAAVDAKRLTLTVYDQDAVSFGFPQPHNVLATATIAAEDLSPVGGWVCATLSAAVTFTTGTQFWIGLYQESDSAALYWYAWYNVGFTSYACARMGSPEWTQSAYAPLLWVGDQEYADGSRPLKLLTGTGADGISRLWGLAGRVLYYIDNTNASEPVLDTSTTTTHELSSDAQDAAWYQAAASANASLFIGLGDADDMQSFNGNIGNEAWTDTYTGLRARAMSVHDAILWLADDRNRVQGWDGTNKGNACRVGDKTYPVRKMVSWNGYLWAGKDDGLYRVTYDTGYPTTGTPEAQKIIDFAPLARADNFTAMCVHQGDLYFSLNQGILRYTAAGVLTPVTPEVGLELAVTERSRCTALASGFNVLYAAFEAPMTGYSTIAAYLDGHWHPFIQRARRGEMLRSLAIEPGWYGDTPRVWFPSGLTLAYIEMPMTTQKRWLWTGLTYRGGGTWYSSWIDGNIRVVDKDWITVTVDAVLPTATEPDADASVTVGFRVNEADAFTSLSQILASGITTVDFPDFTAGKKIQLSLTLNAGVAVASTEATGTPRVEAYILRYMERPSDVQQFTRTYEISSQQTWRNGQAILEDLATRRAWLRTLREAAEPLSWVAWDGTTQNVHLIDYACSEVPEVRGYTDTGTITVTMRLQAV